MTRTSTPLLALVGFLSLASCASRPDAAKAMAPSTAGEAPAPAASAAPDGRAAPVDIQTEILSLEQAERAIDAAFPGMGKDDKNKRELEARAPRKGEPRVRVEEQPASGGGCEIACKALASMTRSADHVCELAGEEDQRCKDAMVRVRSASDRVHAACPACTP